MVASAQKPVALCWAGWFPHEARPVEGIFVRKHLELMGQEMLLHTFTIRHGRRLLFRSYDQREPFGVVRHYEIPSFFLLKTLGYFLLPILEYLRASRQHGRPSVFYLHVSYPYALFALPLALLRIPHQVLTEHWSGYLPADGRFLRLPAVYRKLLQAGLQRFHVILPVSDFLKNHMMKACNIPAERFRVIPNAMTFPEKVMPLPALGPDRDFMILSVALLNDGIKNLSFLIRVVTQVREQIPRLRLFIAGEGPDKVKLMTLAAELGVQENVCFLGYVAHEKLRTYYEQSHLFVLLSRYETFSVVTAEALAHGRPVVATDCGGPTEYVSDLCGFIVPQQDEKAAVQAIIKVYENYGNFSAEAIHAYALSRFSPDSVKIKLLEALKA